MSSLKWFTDSVVKWVRYISCAETFLHRTMQRVSVIVCLEGMTLWALWLQVLENVRSTIWLRSGSACQPQSHPTFVFPTLCWCYCESQTSHFQCHLVSHSLAASLTPNWMAMSMRLPSTTNAVGLKRKQSRSSRQLRQCSAIKVYFTFWLSWCLVFSHRAWEEPHVH